MFCQIFYLLEQLSLCEKCPYSEFFWSVFSRIRTEYGEKRSISVQMRENTNQKNSEYGHFHAVETRQESVFKVVQEYGFWNFFLNLELKQVFFMLKNAFLK